MNPSYFIQTVFSSIKFKRLYIRTYAYISRKDKKGSKLCETRYLRIRTGEKSSRWDIKCSKDYCAQNLRMDISPVGFFLIEPKFYKQSCTLQFFGSPPFSYYKYLTNSSTTTVNL